MKKLFTLLLLLPLAFAGCDEDDESRVETWTVASEKGVTGIIMVGHVPACIVKTDPGADWKIAPDPIAGFAFEKGFESVIRVRIDKIANPPADGSGYRYTMEQLISRTPAQSAVDPLRFSPEFEVTIASERANWAIAAYWFKDMRHTDPRWQAFPWEIEGFEFKPGHEARIRIQPVAEYDAPDGTLRDDDGWTVKYYLRGEVSYEKKDSEGLPVK